MSASSLGLVLGMALVGQWLATRISDGVVHSQATAAALYADSFIASQIQELATQPKLSDASRAALDELLLPQAMGEPVVGFRIWKGDTVVYSDQSDMIGRSFPPASLRDRAWAGAVGAEYEHHEPGHEPRLKHPAAVLEIYAPVRRKGTQEIIALAETYQLAPDLPAELRRAKIASWIVVAAFTAGLLLLQFIIVNRGSRTIAEQRAALDQRIAELSRRLAENDGLRRKSVEANARVTEVNERFLRRIGADLHDGPIQLLGMAMLRLGSLQETVAPAEHAIRDEATADIEVLRDALRECLLEIRNLSAGLAPPAVEDLSLDETVKIAIGRHERRTGTHVDVEITGACVSAPLPIKSCLYRLLQEGLTNAFRHAGGKGQAVTVDYDDDRIDVRVFDSGPGLSRTDGDRSLAGQGLSGLRDRIEQLGGSFHVESRTSGGLCLSAQLPLLQIEEQLTHA